VKFLDRVVDINFYPIDQAKNSNHKWRPVGLGAMGLQDVFFKLGLPFDSQKRLAKISKKIQEEIYYAAVKTSCELAQELGAHENFKETRAAQGVFNLTSGVSSLSALSVGKLKAEVEKTWLEKLTYYCHCSNSHHRQYFWLL
jgi:ribonucleoside-diphosphate reductase alpha chain